MRCEHFTYRVLITSTRLGLEADKRIRTKYTVIGRIQVCLALAQVGVRHKRPACLGELLDDARRLMQAMRKSTLALSVLYPSPQLQQSSVKRCNHASMRRCLQILVASLLLDPDRTGPESYRPCRALPDPK